MNGGVVDFGDVDEIEDWYFLIWALETRGEKEGVEELNLLVYPFLKLVALAAKVRLTTGTKFW